MKRHRIGVGSLIGILLAIWIGWSLVSIVRRNYTLSRQIKNLEGQISNLQNQQDELKYKLQYYQTDSFKEKEARAKLGLQAPGEGVIILPKASTTSQAASTPRTNKSNLQQWWEFLFG